MTPNRPPVFAEPLTEATPIVSTGLPVRGPKTAEGRARALANLKRYAKGVRPEELKAENRPSKRALDREIDACLQRDSGASMALLAQRIVQGALDLNPVACGFLFPRLWPIVADAQHGQKVVFEGIRLELTPTGGAQVTLQRAEQSQSLPNPTDTIPEGGVEPSS
jgi:hypothetical protein